MLAQPIAAEMAEADPAGAGPDPGVFYRNCRRPLFTATAHACVWG